jgi:hypothetical protein
MDFHTIQVRTSFLSVLRSLAGKPIITAYKKVLQSLSQDVFTFGEAYGALCERIYQFGDAGTRILHLVQCDSNVLTATLEHPSQQVLDATTSDLQTLSAMLSLSGEDFLNQAQTAFPNDKAALAGLPVFPAGKPLPFQTGTELAAYYRENGYGYFAKASFFTISKNREILAIKQPDPIRLHDLKGYARQKEQVITNTLAFLEKRPANNILLYGDKGTGKSSTVKAVVNEYASRGLKIVELSPNQVNAFPMLCAEAARSPYRIIIFMDDLSFDVEDENFAALKAFIEGGLSGMPDNLILYATSNRRHLVRESFSARQGDDIHIRDTLETITSLSDRFGLEITFSVPDKDEYLSIVHQLADEYGLKMPAEELSLLAERFALRRNGRSPRTARQFISHQLTLQS